MKYDPMRVCAACHALSTDQACWLCGGETRLSNWSYSGGHVHSMSTHVVRIIGNPEPVRVDDERLPWT